MTQPDLKNLIEALLIPPDTRDKLLAMIERTHKLERVVDASRSVMTFLPEVDNSHSEHCNVSGILREALRELEPSPRLPTHDDPGEVMRKR